MQRLRDALSDPLFDELRDDDWFGRADSQAPDFQDTLELWIELAESILAWFQELEEGEEFEVPSKFDRATRVTQWLLGDRSNRRQFDATPLSEVLRVFRDLEGVDRVRG